MDQKKFEVELEVLGLGGYAIGTHDVSGEYTVQVQGHDETFTGPDAFALFAKMIESIKKSRIKAITPVEEEPEECECEMLLIIEKGVHRVSERFASFFGDIGAIKAIDKRLACGEDYNEAEFDGLNLEEATDKLALSITNATMQSVVDMMEQSRPKDATDEEVDEEADEKTVDYGGLKDVPEGIPAEVLDKTLESISSILGIPKEQLAKSKSFATAVSMANELMTVGVPTKKDVPAPGRSPHAEMSRFPKIMTGISGLVYMLFGETQGANTYDCFVLGHQSREDTEYKDETSIVARKNILHPYTADLSPQMNSRLQKSLTAYAQYVSNDS